MFVSRETIEVINDRLSSLMCKCVSIRQLYGEIASYLLWLTGRKVYFLVLLLLIALYDYRGHVSYDYQVVSMTIRDGLYLLLYIVLCGSVCLLCCWMYSFTCYCILKI